MIWKAWEKESNQGSKRGSCQAFPSSFEPLPKLGYTFIIILYLNSTLYLEGILYLVAYTFIINIILFEKSFLFSQFVFVYFVSTLAWMHGFLFYSKHYHPLLPLFIFIFKLLLI